MNVWRGSSCQQGNPAPVVSVTPHPVALSAKIQISSATIRTPSAQLRTRMVATGLKLLEHRRPDSSESGRSICHSQTFAPCPHFVASDSYPNGRCCHHWRPCLSSVAVDAAFISSSNYAHRQRVRASRHRPRSGAKSCKSVHGPPIRRTAFR